MRLNKQDLLDLHYYFFQDEADIITGDSFYNWAFLPSQEGAYVSDLKTAIEEASKHAFENLKPRRCIQCGRVSAKTEYGKECPDCGGETKKIKN